MISQAQFAAILNKLWPHGDDKVPGLRDGIVQAFPSVCAKYGIDDDATLAQMMAQLSFEPDAGLEMWENLNYTAQRLVEVWPHHFNSMNADEYAHNPQKLANFIYEPPIHNDLGNRPNSNDGYARRGRGLSQITGLDGDMAVTDKTGIDLVNHPEYACAPDKAFEVAVADFVICGCLPYAKAGDIDNVTHKLNGGYNGLAERKVWLSKWKSAITNVQPDAQLPKVVPKPKPEHTGGAAAGTAAGTAAHIFGFAPWEVAAIAVGVAIAAFVIIKFINRGK